MLESRGIGLFKATTFFPLKVPPCTRTQASQSQMNSSVVFETSSLALYIAIFLQLSFSHSLFSKTMVFFADLRCFGQQ